MNYWLYPTQSATAPTVATATGTGDVSNPGANVANYNSGADWNGQNGNPTTVGSAAAASNYGTFDQGGSVWEWNEVIEGLADSRGTRGGWYGNLDAFLQSSFSGGSDPTSELYNIGFRVSSLVAIPEPSTYAAIVGGLGLWMALWRRRGRRTL